MKVQIDKRYPLACSVEIAWEFLQNIEAVATCMPGAKITERTDATHYRGTVTTKLGPATMSFRGEVEVTEVDAGARSLRLLGKGTDSTGSSAASMNLSARIEPADAGTCCLIGASEISMSGKAAAFGGRMMSTVGDQILQQFASNFASQVEALQARRSGNTAPDGPALLAASSAGSLSAASAGDVARTDVPSSELNVLALAWSIFKGWLRSLFFKKTA